MCELCDISGAFALLLPLDNIKFIDFSRLRKLQALTIECVRVEICLSFLCTAFVQKYIFL
jgi:hypothetical protein